MHLRIRLDAPWCGHCKNLAPVYEELGTKLKGSPNVVIAKIDGTANEIDVPGVEVQGFPSIFFFPGNNKSAPPKKYDGGRDLDGFLKYLKENYPLVYEHTEYQEVNGYGLVFKLKGSNSGLQPILFLSHMDVVPPGDADVKNKEENIFRPQDKPAPSPKEVAEDWDYEPFSGAVANGRIYGRGA